MCDVRVAVFTTGKLGNHCEEQAGLSRSIAKCTATGEKHEQHPEKTLRNNEVVVGEHRTAIA